MADLQKLYESLPLGEHHIRILQLAKDPSGEVYATMQVVDLATQPDYTCLSYTWGAPTWDDTSESWDKADKYSININTYSMGVRPNLKNAMNHLHGALQKKPIWIDAICINQNNQCERNAQVQMMARIYEQASNVMVWLGESSPISKKTMENMDHFPLSLDMTKFPQGHKSPTLLDAFVMSFYACPLDDQEQLDIVKFLTGNRWFSRVWTTQEWILAKKIQFLCGDDLANLETIWKGSAICSLEGLIPGTKDIDKRRRDWVRYFTASVCSENNSSSRTDKLSLGMNSDLYRHLEATDPRDKVFGLLGISQTKSDCGEEPFVVDYSLSIGSIFTKAAANGLLVQKDLHGLSYVGEKTEGERTEDEMKDLPSWVPDLTRNVPWSSFSTRQYFKATSEPAVISLNLKKSSALGLEAYPIDSILSTCDASWGHAGSEEAADMFAANFFRLLAQPSAPACYDEDLASIILRLVLADGFIQHMDPRKDPKVVEMFEKWILSRFPHDEDHRARLGLPHSVKLLWARTALQVHNMVQEARATPEPLLDDSPPIAQSAQELFGVIAQYRQKKHSDDNPFMHQWRSACENRHFFRTTSGYVGIGPRKIQVGDQVMLLKGGQVPYILRRRCIEPETTFNFVGEAYLHGFMFGEGLRRHDFEWTRISIY